MVMQGAGTGPSCFLSTDQGDAHILVHDEVKPHRLLARGV